METNPKVFITYAHNTEQFLDKVPAFTRLEFNIKFLQEQVKDI